MDWLEVVEKIREPIQEAEEKILRFLRDIVAIPSMEGQIREVGERIAVEMKRLDFEEVRFDRMGNIIGRIGTGPIRLLYDSHIDTVGLGDQEAWKWDPFQGKIENGIFYGRGTCDEKGSTPGMIYGLALSKALGLLEGFTAYYFGNMEEWCDGISGHALVEVEGICPDYVVIGESTRMRIYRGHKGRIELKITAKGRSAHAASNELGDNAIYKLIPILAGVQNLGPSLGDHPFLGKGRITVTDMNVKTVSINAVPDEATLWIDRRLTFGETKEQALRELMELVSPENRNRGDIRLEILHYREPSYTGFIFPQEKYFPPWELSEEHPLVQAGLKACQLYLGKSGEAGKWNFSTNGTYWMGKAGIPSIGFGPGDEAYAHSVMEQIPLREVVDATGVYALLPAVLREGVPRLDSDGTSSRVLQL
jgi:putative selenium metabolism hydrolase